MRDTSSTAQDRVRRELAWQFNLQPSLYCHESWLPQGLSDAALPARLHPEALCHRQLSPWLLQRFKLGQSLTFEFDEPVLRLALLDGVALERMAPALGLLACRGALCRTLDAAVLDRVREVCGLQEIGFVVSSVRHFPVREHEGHGPRIDEPSLSELPAWGRGVLLELSARGCPAIVRRVKLKFARGARVRGASRERFVAESRPGIGAWFADEFIPRLAPQWAWLFS